MAREGTHVTELKGNIKMRTSDPTDPVVGDEYWNTSNTSWKIYSGNNWLERQFSSTSTSTTTSSSTSTTSTTTSTSSSTTTSTSTSSSTTTTL